MAGNENSGRKTNREIIEGAKERIKKETIEELAESKVFNHIRMTKSKDRQGVKEIALPVYLKSRVDKSEIKVKQVPIYGGESTIQEHKGDKDNIQPKEQD